MIIRERKQISRVFNRMVENRDNFMKLTKILFDGIPMRDYKKLFGIIAADMKKKENNDDVR